MKRKCGLRWTLFFFFFLAGSDHCLIEFFVLSSVCKSNLSLCRDFFELASCHSLCEEHLANNHQENEYPNSFLWQVWCFPFNKTSAETDIAAQIIYPIYIWTMKNMLSVNRHFKTLLCPSGLRSQTGSDASRRKKCFLWLKEWCRIV